VESSDEAADQVSDETIGGSSVRAADDHGWLYNHIGRLSGLVLVALAMLGLTFLAAIGFSAALSILVFLFGGVLLIILGGKVHRA
jgi:hypothetical protein